MSSHQTEESMEERCYSYGMPQPISPPTGLLGGGPRLPR